MPSGFTLRPKVDSERSDNWEPYALKSDPTKDWWEHIFGLDDGFYIYGELNKRSIGTRADVSEDDIPSISSEDGELTNITCYARGMATPPGIRPYQLHATVHGYGNYLELVGDEGYVTHSYACVEYLDLEDDLWTLELGGFVSGSGLWGERYFDYVYAIINYVPYPPTCYQQSIVVSDDIKTLTVSETRYRYYTWLKARGYEVQIKETEEVIYTDEVEDDRSFRKMQWFEGARYTEREIDIGDYVRCGITYRVRSWGETDDGIGYGAWVEFTLVCPRNYPLSPILFPARPRKEIESLKRDCINFEESMSDICLVFNNNNRVIKLYLQEIYGDAIHVESSNLRDILPSQQLIILHGKDLDLKAIINNFIKNISDMFILINDSNTIIKQWLDDYEPDEAGHEFTDVKMKPIVISEDLSKAMDDLFEGIEDNVTILNANLEVLKERF